MHIQRLDTTFDLICNDFQHTIIISGHFHIKYNKGCFLRGSAFEICQIHIHSFILIMKTVLFGRKIYDIYLKKEI